MANVSVEKKIDLSKIKPYGDTFNDGMMQLSFSLPVPGGAEAEEAARLLVRKMGLDEPNVVYSRNLDIGYTFFVVYGKCRHEIDFTSIKVPKMDADVMDRQKCERFIAENIGRDIKILGACTGTDAHTVGIDAIINMKGFRGHFGLERYRGIEAVNMGSQVPNEALAAKAVEIKADAILVSQIVTQKDVHIKNLTELVELLEAEGYRDKVILVCGGPRISHELAHELGYDAGFGSNTYAEDVASFVLTEVVRRNLM